MASPSLSPVSELCQITIARLPTTPDHRHDDDDHGDDTEDDDEEVSYKTIPGSTTHLRKCASQTCAPFLAQREGILQRG